MEYFPRIHGKRIEIEIRDEERRRDWRVEKQSTIESITVETCDKIRLDGSDQISTSRPPRSRISDGKTYSTMSSSRIDQPKIIRLPIIFLV